MIYCTFCPYLNSVPRQIPHTFPNKASESVQVRTRAGPARGARSIMPGRNLSSMNSPNVSQIMGFETAATPRMEGPVVVGLDGVERAPSARGAPRPVASMQGAVPRAAGGGGAAGRRALTQA